MAPTTHIRPRQTREMKRAARHAWRIGKPLSRWVIINIPQPPTGDELRPQRQFSAIRKKAWSWWNHQRKLGLVSGAFCDWRVWESPNGFLHVNWLVHIPDDLLVAFGQKLVKWVAKIIPDLEPQALYNGAIFNVNGLLNYTLKGTDPEKAERFGIEPTYQGEIWGRRAVASMSLGKAARERDWKNAAVVNKAWKYRRPSQHA